MIQSQAGYFYKPCKNTGGGHNSAHCSSEDKLTQQNTISLFRNDLMIQNVTSSKTFNLFEEEFTETEKNYSQQCL